MNLKQMIESNFSLLRKKIQNSRLRTICIQIDLKGSTCISFAELFTARLLLYLSNDFYIVFKRYFKGLQGISPGFQKVSAWLGQYEKR